MDITGRPGIFLAALADRPEAGKRIEKLIYNTITSFHVLILRVGPAGGTIKWPRELAGGSLG